MASNNPLEALKGVVEAAKQYAIAGAKQYVASEAGKIEDSLSASAASNLKSADSKAFAARTSLGGIPISNNTIYIATGIAAIIIAILLIRK